MQYTHTCECGKCWEIVMFWQRVAQNEVSSTYRHCCQWQFIAIANVPLAVLSPGCCCVSNYHSYCCQHHCHLHLWPKNIIFYKLCLFCSLWQVFTTTTLYCCCWPKQQPQSTKANHQKFTMKSRCRRQPQKCKSPLGKLKCNKIVINYN